MGVADAVRDTGGDTGGDTRGTWLAGGAALRPASVAKGGCGTPPPSILRARSLSHSLHTLSEWAHALSGWAHG
eukprot:6618365-Prymnesium_polylepis.1